MKDPSIRLEAKRLARQEILKEMKRQGKKVSNYSYSTINKAALELVKTDQAYLKKARKNLKR